MKEITYDELKRLPKDSYELIDIRDEGLVAYGMIPGAINFMLKIWKAAGTLQKSQRRRS